MDLNKIGSLSNYMSNLKLETKWNQKKKSGDLGSQSKKSELEIKNEQFKAQYYNQRENNPEDETLKTINTKIAAGTKLSPTEMRYLQSKNPALYQKLKSDEQQEKAFEKKLHECKTKDDVDRLKMSSVSKALSTISSAKGSNIPEGTKLEIAASEMRKLQKIEKIVAKFVKSGEYSKLPTEAEVHKAEKEIAEAKQNQTEEILEVSKDKEKVSTTQHENVEKTEIKSENNCDVKETEKFSADEKSDKTVTEAEHSVEAEKIRRSKAKKAYIKAENNFSPAPITPDINIEVK